MRRLPWEHFVGAVGLVLLLVGVYMGLFVAPGERHMGEVQRIMYVHVPTAWSAMLAFTLVFVAAVGWLWRGKWHWDLLVEASTEVGVILGALMLAQGSIWARPTWGVWWDWDPRLTTSAVMVLSFSALLALRGFVDDPEKRATWTAVAAIIAFVDVPIVYYSVRWWRSLHQLQSSTSTMDPTMVKVLGFNGFAVLLLTVWFIARRYRIARTELDAELQEVA